MSQYAQSSQRAKDSSSLLLTIVECVARVILTITDPQQPREPTSPLPTCWMVYHPPRSIALSAAVQGRIANRITSPNGRCMRIQLRTDDQYRYVPRLKRSSGMGRTGNGMDPTNKDNKSTGFGASTDISVNREGTGMSLSKDGEREETERYVSCMHWYMVLTLPRRSVYTMSSGDRCIIVFAAVSSKGPYHRPTCASVQ